jgi:hypothetical protein
MSNSAPISSDRSVNTARCAAWSELPFPAGSFVRTIDGAGDTAPASLSDHEVANRHCTCALHARLRYFGLRSINTRRPHARTGSLHAACRGHLPSLILDHLVPTAVVFTDQTQRLTARYSSGRLSELLSIIAFAKFLLTVRRCSWWGLSLMNRL